MRALTALTAFAGGTLAMTLIFTATSLLSPPTDPEQTPAAAAVSAETLQSRLKRLPGDHRAWAQLGAEYIEKARVTGDPAFYPKAEEALATALRLAPDDDAALTGQAALAAARHDFTRAATLAGRAIAANPYGATAYGVLADARTQLGDLAGADRAIERMMALRPGVPAFSRASYAAELRGDLAEARRYLEYALRDAYQPADRAFCAFRLGELAVQSGALDDAWHWYGRALAESPGHPQALAGQAKVLALRGRLAEAMERYETVIGRLPLPQYLIELGEVRLKAGLRPDWTLLDAQRRLAEAAGVLDDLTWAEFEADHGDPERAVRHARAEYARNPNIVVADALAWALHRAGRSTEALRHAKEATATGWRSALAHHHRAEIERAVATDGADGPGSTESADDAESTKSVPGDGNALGAEATKSAVGESAALVSRYNPAFAPDLPALARTS